MVYCLSCAGLLPFTAGWNCAERITFLKPLFFYLWSTKHENAVCAFDTSDCQEALAQTSPDAYLLGEINKIKALDNHTHVPKVLAAGEKDDDFDALPCGNNLEPSADPNMARPDNPLFLAAWQKLYGYKYSDRDPAHVRELLETKQRVAREQGDTSLHGCWINSASNTC